MPLAGTYFFPADLPHYVTRWNVASASAARFSLCVLVGTEGVTVRPVFDVDHEQLTSGVWGYFTDGFITASARGFYVTNWEPVNEDAALIGEVYIGIVLEVAEDIDDSELVLGLAEVQLR